MTDRTAHTFSSDFKQFFVRGLAVLLPSVLTLWIVVKAYQFVDSTIAEPINRSIRLAMTKAVPYWSPLEAFEPTNTELLAALAEAVGPGALQDQIRAKLQQLGVDDRPSDVEIKDAFSKAPPKTPTQDALRAKLRFQNVEAWWAQNWYMDIIGLVVAAVAVYVAGRLLGGFVGRRVYRRIERLITTLPVFKQIYPYVKQVVDFLFSDEKQIQFNRVVAVEYPRKGIWSVGFQTAAESKVVGEQAGEMVTVFIPSSPTPFTGYAIMLPRKDVIELPFTVEQAIRFIVSGGVLLPGSPAATGDEAGTMPSGSAKPVLVVARSDEPTASVVPLPSETSP